MSGSDHDKSEYDDCSGEHATTVHVPVMLAEILAGLDPQPGDTICDGTLGGGGHTRELSLRVAPGGVVIGVDRDGAAVDRTRETLGDLPVVCRQASYADLPDVLAELRPHEESPTVQGILLDLGLSSDQLADDNRGFSYTATGDFDLRFDVDSGEPAWRLVNRLSEKHLADLIYQYGEERFSRRIASRIVTERRGRELRSATDLAEIIRRAVPPPRPESRSKQGRKSGPGGRSRRPIHPATRTFQALRIAVNGELDELEKALKVLPDLLAPGGRLAIISFHSLEDRIVKHAFRGDDRLDVVTKTPLTPTAEETAVNIRARSAKLRIATRK